MSRRVVPVPFLAPCRMPLAPRRFGVRAGADRLLWLVSGRPENVLLGSDGYAKLTDWGAACGVLERSARAGGENWRISRFSLLCSSLL